MVDFMNSSFKFALFVLCVIAAIFVSEYDFKNNRSPLDILKTRVATSCEKNIDLGDITEECSYKIALTNTGQHDLIVNHMETRPRWIRVIPTSRSVAPDSTMHITVKICPPKTAGTFTKEITLFCNLEESPLRFTFTGNNVIAGK